MIHGRVRTHLFLCCLALPLVLVGCSGATSSPFAAPVDTADLRRRALDLLLRAASSDTPETRCNAIEALARVAPRDGVPAFRANLKHDSPLVRFAACAAIGETRDRDSLDAVLRLTRDKDARVRLGAAFAAVRLGQERNAEILAKSLSESQDENIRADAAYLIGRLGDRKVVRRLRYAVGTERSGKVIITAYGALAALGESEAVDRLIEFVQGATETRVMAMLTLADIGADRAKESFAYRLKQKDEYIQTRLLAARGLGRLGDHSGFELALDATRESGRNELETYYIHSAAAHALGAIGDARALDALRQLAGSQDDQVQVAACYAILEITDAAPPPPAAATTQNPPPAPAPKSRAAPSKSSPPRR